jgi:hypothetical protein
LYRSIFIERLAIIRWPFLFPLLSRHRPDLASYGMYAQRGGYPQENVHGLPLFTVQDEIR